MLFFLLQFVVTKMVGVSESGREDILCAAVDYIAVVLSALAAKN